MQIACGNFNNYIQINKTRSHSQWHSKASRIHKKTNVSTYVVRAHCKFTHEHIHTDPPRIPAYAFFLRSDASSRIHRLGSQFLQKLRKMRELVRALQVILPRMYLSATLFMPSDYKLHTYSPESGGGWGGPIVYLYHSEGARKLSTSLRREHASSICSRFRS